MRKLIVLLLAVSLLGITPANAATAKAGAKCSKHKATSTVKAMKYTCIKSGRKLVWNKGVAIKKSPAIKAGVCPPKSGADLDPGITQDRANALISMTEAAAEECAMNLDWLYRVGMRDGEMYGLTLDYRMERVTVTLVDGFVTEVNLG